MPSLPVRIVCVVCCLLTFGLPAFTPREFESAAALNSFIEKGWSNKSIRKDLYGMALAGLTRWPEDAELLGRAGYLESMLGNGDHGVDKTYRAWKKEPGHWALPIWAFDVLTDRAHKSKPNTVSVPLFLKAIEVKPSYAADGYYYAAVHCWSLDPVDRGKAVEYFRKAIAAGNNGDRIFRELGQLYIELNRLPEAEAALREALARDPKNPFTLFFAARAALRAGNLPLWAERNEAAVANRNADFTKSLEAQTRDWLAQEYAGRFGLLAKARAHLQYLVDNFPADKQRDSWRDRLYWLSPRRMTVTFEYAWPRGATEVELVLPVANAFQKHLSRVFQPVPDRVAVYSRFGNTYARVGYAADPGRVRAITTIDFTPCSFVEGGFPEDVRADGPARYQSRDVDSRVVLDPADPELRRLAGTITAGGRNTVARAQLIQDWIEKNIKYKVVYPLSIAEYLKLGEAECGGHALIFVALCRAAGIPARRVFAPLCGVPAPQYLGSHMVSEFFVAGTGWIPVDNSGHVFGRTTSSIFFWRVGRTEDPDKALYPEKTDQTVAYTRFDGKPWMIKRD